MAAQRSETIEQLAAMLALPYRVNHIPDWKIIGIQRPPNRSFRKMPGRARKSCQHGTGNFNPGATAHMHENFVRAPNWGTVVHPNGTKDVTSYHWVGDDVEVVELLDYDEQAYHGGTAESNQWWLSCEMCENGGHYGAKTLDNVAMLQACICVKEGYDDCREFLVQHHEAYGKDCPYTIRHTPGAWDALLAATNVYIARLKAILGGTPDSQTFPETGKEVHGEILRYFISNGGVGEFGFPVTNEYLQELEDGKVYTVQLFEKAMLHYREDQGVGRANIGTMYGKCAGVLP